AARFIRLTPKAPRCCGHGVFARVQCTAAAEPTRLMAAFFQAPRFGPKATWCFTRLRTTRRSAWAGLWRLTGRPENRCGPSAFGVILGVRRSFPTGFWSRATPPDRFIFWMLETAATSFREESISVWVRTWKDRRLCLKAGFMWESAAARRSVWAFVDVLGDSQQFVRLQTQPPLWVLFAKLDCHLGVALQVLAVHRLNEEMIKTQVFKQVGLGAFLRINEFEFAAR